MKTDEIEWINTKWNEDEKRMKKVEVTKGAKEEETKVIKGSRKNTHKKDRRKEWRKRIGMAKKKIQKEQRKIIKLNTKKWKRQWIRKDVKKEWKRRKWRLTKELELIEGKKKREMKCTNKKCKRKINLLRKDGYEEVTRKRESRKPRNHIKFTFLNFHLERQQWLNLNLFNWIWY